jgi:hypothetical protein
LSLKVNRREFLQLGGLACLAVCQLPQRFEKHLYGGLLDQDEPIPTMGRITANNAKLYDGPSFSSRLIKEYWKDLVFPITSVTLGEEPAYNRVWYGINAEGYMHSGIVQPVEIILNDPFFDLPKQGRLAEVTVPYTDTVFNIKKPEIVAYRLYYGTTYWVSETILEGSTYWYKIVDDYFPLVYYVKGEHLHVIDEDEVSPISADIDPTEKRIEVILADQVMIAYEKDTPVFMSKVSSGASWTGYRYSTPTGRHYTFYKRPSRHMASGAPGNPVGYDLPGVPWVCFINKEGISFHGTYWHNDFGKPRSHGCINLPTSAAKWLYRWTLPSVPFEKYLSWKETGTRVDVI